MASEKRTSKSNGSSTDRASRRRALAALKAKFVICVDSGESVDLQLRRVYRVKTDRKSALQGFVRIIDDSGEDYLYPANYFVPVHLPARAAKAVRNIA